MKTIESLQNILRPSNWSEIVGQEVAVSVLSKQIAENKLKQAFLFCGGSGTGKTSAARVMCRQLNGEDGYPDEFDASRNSDIGSIRDLIESVKRVSLDQRYRVVIIDECHNLQNKSFDTLLKTLEEPPKHVIFILCTTEPDKIPNTIKTRCQRFDFYRVDKKTLADNIRYVCKTKLEKPIEDYAAKMIAESSDGSVRESLKLLEQCYDYGDLTEENVEKVLNKYSIKDLIELLRAFQEDNGTKAIEIQDRIVTKNHALVNVFDQLIRVILDLKRYYINRDVKNTMFTENPEINMDLNPYLEELMSYRTHVNQSTAEILFKKFAMGGKRHDI